MCSRPVNFIVFVSGKLASQALLLCLLHLRSADLRVASLSANAIRPKKTKRRLSRRIAPKASTLLTIPCVLCRCSTRIVSPHSPHSPLFLLPERQREGPADFLITSELMELRWGSSRTRGLRSGRAHVWERLRMEELAGSKKIHWV